ncbi:MAG: 8-amino-7-oxononanoate synthase [Gammaproteobacteria bacterium]|nr:8-amino-7-oxononanoate synthase [Gammaproteobacteria bacterium]MCF6364563.1 8-amino-7-oxononanoate synthase [Gammaproteobacteria bacterium]
MEAELNAALIELRTQALYRSRRVVDGPQAPQQVIDGREVLSFCSNDYLGLANHPEVIAALQRGADDYGVGAGAAHLINGHSRAHHVLEEALAEFTGYERALLFSTGYMANLGVITALLGKADAVFEDRLNHASLIDAGRLSGARLRRYRHVDPSSLDGWLGKHPQGRRLVVTDGVFSMDGDLAPLPALAASAARNKAWLMVDDAHGLGVLGRQGRGTLDHFGMDACEVPVLMGTLGKAFGTSGAFVAGSEALIETLIQQARSYIYTTALPPALAEATCTSLRLLQRGEGRRERLAALIQRFRHGAGQLGLELMVSETPIQPIVMGETARVVAVSEALLRRGILVTAIRPPTVPAGSARLRVTLSAAHSETQVDRLLDVLGEVAA